jgi:hypothetical protein
MDYKIYTEIPKMNQIEILEKKILISQKKISRKFCSIVDQI